MNDHAPIHATPTPTDATVGTGGAKRRPRWWWARRARRAVLVTCVVGVSLMANRSAVVHAFGDLKVDIGGVSPAVPNSCLSCAAVPPTLPDPFHPDDKIIAGAQTLIPLVIPANRSSAQNPEDAFIVTVRNTDTNPANPPSEPVVFEYRAPYGVTITGMQMNGINASGPIINLPCEIGTELDPPEPSTCEIGQLPPVVGAVTIQIEYYVDRAIIRETLLDHDVRAYLTPIGTDANEADNQDHAFTSVETLADLQVLKSGPSCPFPFFPNNMKAGTCDIFKLAVTNKGPSVARHVFVGDSFLLDPRGGLTIEEARVVETEGTSCSVQTTFGQNTGMLCDLGDIITGDVRYVEVKVCAASDIPDGKNFLNFTAVGSGSLPPPLGINPLIPAGIIPILGLEFPFTPEPCLSLTGALKCLNNVSVLPVTVNSEGDLDIEKSVEPAKVNAGEQNKYTIKVTNNGPSDVLNPIVKDTLPEGVDYEVDNDTCIVRDRNAVGPDKYGYFTEDSGRDPFLRRDGPQEGHDIDSGEPPPLPIPYDPADPGAPFFDIATTGTAIGAFAGGPDDGSANVPIGFNFTFYDEVASSVWVSTNGYLKFGTGGPDTTDPENDCPLTASTPNRAIYAFWDDLDLSTGSVRYRVVTNPQDTSLDVFIVQWSDATIKNSGDQISFQVQLFQGTNQIRIVYGPGVDATPAASGASATVGIEPRMELADEGGGVTFACGDDVNPAAAFLSENQVIAFTQDVAPGDELICRVGEPVKPGSVPAYIEGAFTGYPNMGCIAGLLDLSLPFDNFQVTNDKVFAFRDGSTVTHVMKPGEMRTIEVQGLVDPSIKPGTQITNTAVITGYTTLGDPTTMTMPDNFQPFGGNNTGDTKNLVLQKADLRVTKFGKPDRAVRAGEVLTYTIIVDNYGPSWADDVAIKDVLQASKNFDLIDIHSDRRALCNGLPGPDDEIVKPSEWPLDEPPPAFGVDDDTGVEDIEQRLELDCRLVDDPNTPEGDEMASENTMENRLEVLAADGPPNSGRWIVTLRVRARDTQSLNNVVDVLSPVAADPDRENNHDEVEHEITDVADLEISKTDSGDPFVAGTEFTYYIDVTNHGPSVADNVVVVDTLPLEVSVVSISQPGPGSCATVQGTDGNLQVRCNLGNMGADEDERIEIRVKADPDIPDGTILFNQAVVTSDIYDPTNHDNITRSRSVIIARVDLGVTKVDDPDPVLAGRDLEYRITAVNHGPSNAREVVVRDALPADVTFISANVVSGPGVCLPAPMGHVTCQLGKLGVEQVVEIAVKVRVNEDAPCGVDIVNDVTIESTTDEVSPDPTANADQRRTRVNCDAGLAITKTVSNQTPVAGTELRYTIAVTNNGPSRALDVRVTDDLPPDVAYRLDTFGCGASLFGAGCALGDLAVGQTVRFDVIVALESDAVCGTTLTNVASVDADNAARVEAAADIVVDCESDLWIRKFGKPDGAVQAGETLTYYVTVTNLGPSDTVPGEVYFRDLLASDGFFTVTRIASDHPATCDPDNGPAFPLPFNGVVEGNQDLEIVCTLADDLNPNEQWMVEIDVTADQAQTLNNTADVFHARSLDPNRANDHAEVAHAITDVADLSIVKGDSEDPVTAGESFDYTLHIVNHGPSPAENVVVRDTLPLGLRVTGLSSLAGGTCGLDQPADGAASVVCYLGDLDVNEQYNVTIEVAVPDGFQHGSTLWNAATVDSDVLDPERGDNLDRTRTRVVAEADLEVTKTDDPDPVLAGAPLTYRISVVNHGPSQARRVVVTDDVPAGFTVTSAAPLSGDGVCQALPAGFVTCDLGNLAPGAGYQIVVEGVVDPAAACGTPLFNVVTAGSDTAEPAPDASPNTATQSTAVDCRAALTATKTVSTRTPSAGTDLVYTLSVHNAGPSVAADVAVKDILPPSMTYVLDTRQCGVDLFGVGCDVGNLAPGQTVSFDVVVRLAPDAACRSTLTNTMVVTSTTASSVVARADVVVSCDADLRILKFGKPDGTVRAGEVLSYTVVIDNLGPSHAEGVFIKDIMQSSGTFTVLNISSDRDATCLTDPVAWTDVQGHVEVGCVLDDPLGVLDENGSFPNPGRWIVSMTVMANESQTINNVVDAGARQAHDPDVRNNRAVVEHAITDVADLSISKTDHDVDEPFEAGTTFTYDITVRNDGPSTAENVVVVDTLPIGLDIADLADGCAATTLPTGARKVTCNLGTLVVGAERVITLEVRVRPDLADGTVLWNHAIVLSDVFDPDNRDNIAQTPSRIAEEVDLEVVKLDDPDPVTAGDLLQYRIEVTNHGPSMARDVVLTDDLPAGVTVVSVAPIGGHGTCQPLPIGFATCHFDTLAPGQSETVALVAEVSPSVACGVDLVNVVAAASTSAEPPVDPHANVASAATSVACRGRLAASKLASTYTPVAGGDLIYTLSVRNLGPSVARSVTVTDTLPAGMTYVLDTRGCGSGLFGAGCGLGDLDPGEQVVFDVVVHVAPDAACGAVLANVARFTSTTADPATATADVRVDCAADLRVLKFGKPDGAARAGEVLTYTIVVDNLGPSHAPGTAIKDVLRASGSFDVVSITSDRDHTCAADPAATGGGGPADPWLPNAITAVNIDCTLDEPLGVLRADGFPNPGRWTLTMMVRAREGQSINNVVDATSAAADPEAVNNRARVEHAITDVADLRLVKNGPATATAGGTIQWTIDVANGGPSAADNVVVYDRLPAGVTVTAATAQDGSCATGTAGSAIDRLQCNLGTLASGATRTITIDAQVDPALDDDDRLENDAFVLSDVLDPDNGNNVGHTLTVVGTAANIVFDKDAAPNPVIAGNEIAYRISVTNEGPSQADNVVIEDAFDFADAATVTFLGYFIQGGGGTCFFEDFSSSAVRCNLGDLPPATGDAPQRQIYLRFRVDPDAKSGAAPADRDIDNEVDARSSTPGLTDSGDDDESVPVGYLQQVDVTKIASVNTVATGDALSYHIEVTNNGPSTAFSVALTDHLPADLTFLWASDAACTVGGANMLSCPIGDMAPGETYGVDVHMQVPANYPCATAIQANVATASWDADNFPIGGPDTDSSVDSNTVVTNVNCVADLWIRKFGKPDQRVEAGKDLVYYVSVKNLGPSVAPPNAVRINDLLASSAPWTLTSITSNLGPASCRFDNGAPNLLPFGGAQASSGNDLAIDCLMAQPLGINQEWLLTMTVTSPIAQTMNNQADVYGVNIIDPNPDNNHAIVEHDIFASSDMSIVKTDSADPVTAGSSFDYTLTVRNNGVSQAYNVVVVDTLPLGLRLNGITQPVGGTCATVQTVSGNVKVTCNLANMPASPTPGWEQTIVLDVAVDPSVPAGTQLFNEAVVDADNFDPTNANNIEGERTTIDAASELSVDKTDSPDPVVAGNVLDYVLTVFNGGPSVARNVQVLDTFPAGLTFLGYDLLNGTGSCARLVANQVQCDVDDIAVDDFRSVRLSFLVDPGVAHGTVLNNSATWSASSPVEVNGDTTESTTVASDSDVVIRKVASVASPVAGTELVYTITATNKGTSNANNVTVTDNLAAAGVTFLYADDAACAFGGGTLTCGFGTLGGGQSRTVDVHVTVPADFTCGNNLSNTARVDWSVDANHATFERNASVTTVTPVRCVSDLRITKYGKNDGEVRAGANLDYTIVVDNLGPSWAPGVSIKDVLSSSGVFIVASPSTDRPATCSPNPITGAFAGQHIFDCTLNAPLAVLTSDNTPVNPGRWIYRYTVTANEAQDIDNTATASFAGTAPTVADPEQSNNVAHAEHEITAVADLSITKTDSADPVDAGTELDYVLTVNNAGPSTAENVVVQDTLPLDVDVVSVTPPAGANCGTTQSAAGNVVVTCNLDTFPPGAPARVITIRVRVDQDVPEGARLFNRAWVGSDHFDNDNSDNIAGQDTTVRARPDLSIAKTGPATAVSGTTLEYELVARNNGTATATGVVVTDNLPAGVMLASAAITLGNGVCAQGPVGTVTCQLGDLAPGEENRVTIVAFVKLDPALCGTTLSNVARIDGNQPDGNAGNDVTPPFQTAVRCEADVAVRKSSMPLVVYAGEQKRYSIQVTNHGPSTATNVQVVDMLPPGVDYVVNTAPDKCSKTADNPDTVTCNFGNLAPGEWRTFDIVTKVFANTPADTRLINRVTGTTATSDPVAGNNFATAENVVEQKADLQVQKVGKPDDVVGAREPLVYTVIVDNHGPSWASGVSIKDVIIASGRFDVVSVESDRPATCNALPGGPFVPTGGARNNVDKQWQLDCTLDAPLEVLAADGPPNSGRWIVKVTVESDDMQSINNTVTALSATAYDEDLGNNTARTAHEVRAQANLSISKTDLPDCDPGADWPGNFCDMMGNGDTVAIAGSTDDPDDPQGESTFHWRLEVENEGPSDATNVVVTDNLPAEVEVTRIRKEPDQGACTTVQGAKGQQVVTCNLGTLGDDDEVRIDIYVRVPAGVADGTILWNEAWVTSDAVEPNNEDNRTRARTDVIAVADLGITKTDDPDPAFAAGGEATYTLNVVNHGPSVSRDVVVVDDLPTGLDGLSVDVVGVTDEKCSIGPVPGSSTGRERVTCELGDLGVGDARTILIRVKVAEDIVPADDANQCVNVRNVATVSAATKDPEDDNDEATESQEVCATADLKITKTSEPEKVNAGEQKRYHIEVENLGLADAQGVTVHDVLPDEATYEVDTNGAMCTQPANLVGFRAVMNAANEVPPAPGSGMGLATFVLDTTTNVLEYAIFVNDLSTATTAAHIHTGAAGLNGAALVGLFAGAPPVFDESHPLVGKVTLTPVQAAAILANPGGHYVNVHTTASPGGEIRGQLARALQTPLECEIGALAAGAKHAFDIFALIDADTMAGTTITNVALVFADVPPDGVLYNNADYSKNYVESKADLRVVKFGKPDAQVRAGDILTYTVIVDNLGPSSAKGVAIKDVLRASGTFDLINIDSDRDFECISDPNPASGAGTPADPLVPNNRQSLDIDCTLDGALGVLEADGFPNPGRWTLTMYVQADETQSINNVVDVLSAALDPKLENNHAQVEHEITDVSDMGIDKIGPMMVIAGDQLTYELVVTNHGPSTSENVVVYDRLPPGIVVTEATVVGGGGTCTTGTPANPLDKLECGLGTLNVGASKTVRIVATVSASVPAGTVLENDAFVLSDKFDDDNSNNYDTVLTTVKRAADLVVTKVSERNDVEDASDNAEPTAVAGETIEYTITVTNQGISDAADVLVVDRLPYGTEYLSANVTVGQGACLGLPTGEVKCQLGTMVAGATYEIVVRAQVQANYDCAARPNLINVVEATTSSETDPATLANNAYTLTTPVACVADVKVEKWSDPIKVYAGEQKKYTVRVTNLGPSDALNVVMEDTLPVEVEYDIDTGGCAVALGEPDVVTCDIGTLPPGGTYEVEIYTTVDPNTAPGTELVNEAVVTTTTADPDEDNNRDTSENLVLQKADLHVRKFGKPDGKVRAGDVLTYTVIVDNLGPSWANGVALKDVLQSSGDFDLIDILSDREASCRILPAGVVPTDVTLGATAWPPDAPPAAFGVTPPTGVSQIENRLEVDCTLTDPLAVLAADGPPNSGRWIVTMRVRARMTQDLNNVASVLSEAYDPDRTNNDAFVEHEITDVADLRIIKAQVDENGDPLPMPMIVAGTTMYYAITVTNGGPSTAENVVVTDRLPAGVTVTSASVEGGGSCTTGAAGSALDKLACGLGDLTTGSTKVVRVTADVSAWVPQGAVLENDAHVTSDIYDPDNGNNYAHVLTTVKTVADLGVEKYGNPDPIKAGDITSYEIVFRNNGPSVARDVILTDYLPGEFDLLRVYVVDGSPVSDSATCHTLTEDPGMADRATCELGDIAPGQEGRVVVIVRVKSDTPAGVYTNTVTIESDTAEPDPDETPNSATFDTTIAPMADLWIEKWSDPVKVNAGEQKKYTIRVTNLGPSDAENVVVTDTLPKEVDYEIDTGLCTVAANSGANGEDVVTCGFGTMKPGQVKTVDIYALVEPQTAPGSFIVNRADVTSDTPDGINEDNNTAYSENFVLQKADLKITKFGKMDDRVRAGEVLTYTVIVDNLGPSWASKAAVKDIIQTGGTFDFIDVRSDRAATCKVLPAGLVPTTVVLPAAAWPVVDPPPAFGVIAGNGVANIEQRLQVDCNLGGALEALEPNGPPNKGRWILTMRFRARQAQSVNNVASVVNVVPIEGDPSNGNLATDPDPSNNMAMVEHEITDVADLTVVKSATGQVVTGCAANGTTATTTSQANMVTAGLDLTYTLVVTNKGPSDAENVVVYDRLPPGVVLKSGTVDGSATKFANWCATGTPGSPLDKLVCGVGTLYSQPSAGKPNTTTIVFTVTVDPALANGAVLENDAYVASDVFDPINQNWANNLTTVKTSADLRLDKTDDHDPVVAGKLLRYTLGVTNDGPSVARDVWVYDDLPADVVYVGSIGAACYEDPVTAGNIACQVGDMAPGEMRFVYLIVQVKPDAAMTLTNTAVAQSGFSDDTPLPTGKLTSDPCPGDNTDTETTTVTRETDPFVMKTDLTDPVIAGKPARYQIMFGNNGPSTATSVEVKDVLPEGFMFNRCESIDPNDLVTCTADAAMKTVTLQSIKLKNTVVWTSDKANAANKLEPGESYTFVIVADVSPGYVLDGQTDGGAGGMCEAYAKVSDYLFWGWDRATIASLSNVSQKEVDTNLNNNFDDECTRVNAEADLSIVKTDIFGNPATDPGNYFLECDPVEPGGMITYDLTVKNNGMSDAAQVQVVDQLPAEFVALDPAQVTITFPDGVGTGQIVEVRDDGKITLLLGNDPFRKGPNAVPAPAKRQLGRINAGSTHRARIQVMVVNPWEEMTDKRFVNPMPPYDKICGALLLNTATVSTIKGPAVLPGNVPGWPLKDQTPTADPDLTNNTDTETTKIECPAIQVEKTVSFDGQCPGTSSRISVPTGKRPTFCFAITNVGTTYLDEIVLVDTIRTTMGTIEIHREVIRSGKTSKMPVAPGETVLRQVEIPPLTNMCGTVTNAVDVTAIPVNSGRTVYPCLSPVAHTDSLSLDVPCGGADYRIALPALNPDTCETWLQVQNVGDEPTKALMLLWGLPGACPPQAAGPLKLECTGLLRPGSAWSFPSDRVPPGTRSAIVYSFNAADEVKTPQGNLLPFADVACRSLFQIVVGDDLQWIQFNHAYRAGGTFLGPLGSFGEQLVLDFGAHPGQPVAVSVNRTCPDPVDPNRDVSAAYTGISSDRLGTYDPVYGGFAYYAPLVFANKGGLNSVIHLQNLGIECSSLELWFKGQDNCLRPILGDVLAVAPGESIVFDPNSVVGPDWVGSAWIRASEPMALVIDTLGPNHFTSYTGVPADVYDADNFSLGSMVNYAPLVYSEYQGWDSAIQVQNLSGATAAKVKVYFLDRSGDVITTVVDWICPRGSQTFFLPVISNMPGNWVGHARVESQEWWTPGTTPVSMPNIQSVVLLERWSDPARSERREAVAYNALTEQLAFDWQVGKLGGGTQSGSAVIAVPLLAKANRGISSELAITNLVSKPGFTDFAIYIYDQNGLLDHVCQKLHDRQVEYIDLATWGYVPQRYLGSAVISATFWEHEVFDPGGGFQRNLVGLGAVVVERVNGAQNGTDVPGDESKAFEAIPIFDQFVEEPRPSCGP